MQVDGFSELVTEYEGRALKGPNSCVFASDGTLYFTDSGPLGDTSLQRRQGSVYSVSAETRILKPLALNCLAHPSGIAVSPDSSTVYVAEMLANRILRFVRRPAGGFVSSVFKQFNGYVGPSSIFCDSNHHIVVGRFEFASGQQQVSGCLTVLDSIGNVLGEVLTPVPQVGGEGRDTSLKYIIMILNIFFSKWSKDIQSNKRVGWGI